MAVTKNCKENKFLLNNKKELKNIWSNDLGYLKLLSFKLTLIL